MSKKEKTKLMFRRIFFSAVINIIFIFVFFNWFFPMASKHAGFYYVGLNSISIKPQNLTLQEVRYVVNHEGGHYLGYRIFGYTPNLRLRWFGFDIGNNVYKKITINKMFIICLLGIFGGLLVAIFSPVILIFYLLSCFIDYLHIYVYLIAFFKGYKLNKTTINNLEKENKIIY